MGTKWSIFFIATALFIGSSVYILFRTPLSWFPDISGWDRAIINLSGVSPQLSAFIKFHLSDVMWALAFAETVYIIKNSLWLGVIVALVATILYEAMQYFGVIRGTGDIWDIFFVAISLAIYFILRKRGIMYEKQQI